MLRHCNLHSTYMQYSVLLPSVLWRCWLGYRKGIRPVKNWVVGCWCGYLSGVRCRLASGPADATATHCLSCFSKIQIGSTFLVSANLGSPGKKAVKWVCVCVCACACACACVCVCYMQYSGCFSCFTLLWDRMYALWSSHVYLYCCRSNYKLLT